MPKGVYDHRSLPAEERFWAKVEKSDGCWEWAGSRQGPGYGRFCMGRSASPAVVYAHRFSYELNVGVIPNGMTVDHLCFNTGCVRPDHLRLLTASENSKNTRKALATHCQRGHEFTEYRDANGRRRCKECHDAVQRARRERVAGVPDSSSP